MSPWERFPNAPIVEALLDIHVTFSSPIDLQRLEQFHEAIRDRYPTKQEQVLWELQFGSDAGAIQQAAKSQPRGFMFKSADGRRIVQARRDGFTFNWLKPYETWEALREEAHPHWDRYVEMFTPTQITKLGLRYINRLELPLPFNDFREYVKTAPDIAEGIPQSVSALFMRLEVPKPDSDLVAILTETIEPVIGEDMRLPFIFDIDVVRTVSIEPSSPDIWESFERMREYKNNIFFASTTDKAKEMFR